MAGDVERLRWVLELGADATSLLRVVDEIEARFNTLTTRAGTAGTNLVGGGPAAENLARDTGELAAAAKLATERVEALNRATGGLFEDLLVHLKDNLNPQKIVSGVAAPLETRNTGPVTTQRFTRTATIASAAALDAVNEANAKLAASSQGLAEERAKSAADERVVEADYAELIAGNKEYIKNTVRLRSAQQKASADIEAGLSINRQYLDSLARTRIAQEQALAAVKERLVTEGSIAGEEGAYAQALARTKVAQAEINAQTAKLLAENPLYIEALVAAKNARALETKKVQEALAIDDEYIAATAAAIEARRKIKANVEAVNTGTLVVPGEPVDITEANVARRKAAQALQGRGEALQVAGVPISPLGVGAADAATNQGIVAAGEKILSNKAKLAEVTEQLAIIERQKLAGTTTDLEIQQQIDIAQNKLNVAIKERVAAAQKAAFEARVANGTDTSTFFQRLQSQIAGRSGNFRSPDEFQKLGQFVQSRFLTTAGFAVSGLATYAVFAGLQKMITDSTALEKTLQQIRAEFTALGESGSFAGFRNGILQISSDTGTAATEVAKLALQFKGAFAHLDNGQILDQVRAAVELSRVTGLSLQEITNNLTATANVYDVTVRQIGDAVLTLQDRTGTAAAETITFVSDMAEAADQAGATFNQVAAIGAVAAKYTGQTGASIAEGFNRILPSIETKAANIITLFQQGAPTKVQEVIKDLAAGKTFAVFDLIGKSYKNLTVAQQDYLASLLGSRRDAKTAITTWENYAEVLRDVKAEQDGSGRLEQSYAALQDTLSQQLQKVLSALRNIGAVLLSLGLSEAVQVLAKALGGLVTAVADILSWFGKLNDLSGGLAGKIIGIALAVGVLYRALTLVETVGAFGAFAGIANKLPGVNIAAGAGAVRGVTGEAAQVPPGVLASGEGEVLLGAGAATQGKGLIAAIKNVGTQWKLATAETTGIFATSAAGLKASLLAIGDIFATFLPLLIVAGTAQIITSYTQSKRDVDAASKAYDAILKTKTFSELSSGAQANSKDAIAYDNQLAPRNPGFNPLKVIPNLAHDVAAAGKPSAVQKQADERNRRQAEAEALILSRTGSQFDIGRELQGFTQAYTQTNGPTTSAPDLTKADIDAVAKTGKVAEKKAKEIQLFFTYAQAAAGNNGVDLNAEFRKLIKANDDKIKAGRALQQGLKDLPDLQAELSSGIITPQEFVSKADTLLAAANTVLITAEENGSSSQTIQTLLNGQKAIQQAKDQAVGQIISDFQSTRNLVNSLKGGTSQQQSLANIQTGIQALQIGFKIDPTGLAANAPQIAAQIIQGRQQLIQQMADNAATGAEAERILNTPVNLSAVESSVLNFVNIKANPHVLQVLTRAAATLGRNVDEIILKIVTDKEGLDHGLAILQQQVKDKIAAAGHLGDKKYTDFLDLLGGLKLPKSITTYTPPKPTYAPKDIQAAQDQANIAANSLDPVAAAHAAQQAANDQLKNAVGPIQKAQAQAAINSANNQYTQAIEGISQAKASLVAAEAHGDPVKVAEAAIAAANLQYAQAHSEAERLQAEAAQIQAQDQFKDAMNAITDAKIAVISAQAQAAGDAIGVAKAAFAAAYVKFLEAKGKAERLNALAAEITAKQQIQDAINALFEAERNVVVAQLTAAGKTVEAAKAQLKEDTAVYNRFLAQHPGQTRFNNATAAGLFQKTITDAANVRDTALQNSLDDIQFLLDTHKISNGNAIARLKLLDSNVKLTKQEHHQIEEQIYNLQHQNEQDLQFNLPSDIRLPTLYEARRFDQSAQGGASHYQDNRVVTINVTTNAKLDGKDVQRLTNNVTDSLNQPPRYGVRRGAY